jgi:hypothetical protein
MRAGIRELGQQIGKFHLQKLADETSYRTVASVLPAWLMLKPEPDIVCLNVAHVLRPQHCQTAVWGVARHGPCKKGARRHQGRGERFARSNTLDPGS